ncbi:MAG TPA: amidohydrolase family protein [Balneolaceae bacterium]|nr:amidohydrolase family protein [Balneolaceae bacterium]
MISLKALPKIDAHIHFNADRTDLLELANEYNYSLLTINTEVPEFPSVKNQQKLAQKHRQSTATKLSYATTVPTDDVFEDGWAENAIKKIGQDVSDGACGVKFWKNIGMSIQRPDGSFLKLDDPKFEPVFSFLEEQQIPVLGHQGEPKNCWLPVEQMTVKSDRDYFSSHPQYHMYLHDEYPDYSEHIKARDHILERHPDLNFVGLHLASLEWNLDEVANRLDKHPHFAVDLAERFSHLYYHAVRNRNKVKKFFEKYQDRIIYGTDIIDDPQQDATDIIQELKRRWEKHWLFLSTDKKLHSRYIDQSFFGLDLPESILEKVYHSNAQDWYLLS